MLQPGLSVAARRHGAVDLHRTKAENCLLFSVLLQSACLLACLCLWADRWWGRDIPCHGCDCAARPYCTRNLLSGRYGGSPFRRDVRFMLASSPLASVVARKIPMIRCHGCIPAVSKPSRPTCSRTRIFPKSTTQPPNTITALLSTLPVHTGKAIE